MIIMGGEPGRGAPGLAAARAERQGAATAPTLIVIDPRLTRTAAHATEYVRIRSGTDIPVIWGLMWHIFKNGWEDKDFIAKRVYGMDDVRKEVEKWDPKTVEDVTGVPGAQMKRVAQTFATQKPSTLIWCMGVTQQTVGTANVRAYLHLLLADRQCRRGRAPAPTSSAATATCRARPTSASMSRTCLAYYGLVEGAWRHWARVWGVSITTTSSRASTRCRPRAAARHPHHARQNMETSGHPLDPLVRRHEPAGRAGRPEGQPQGHVRHGPWRQHHHRACPMR
jgi:formate dehydrogenase major subunit